MAKTTTHPKIEVLSVYLGGRDMREVFISLLVNEVQNGKTSPRTFEIIKDTEYNGDRKERKGDGMNGHFKNRLVL